MPVWVLVFLLLLSACATQSPVIQVESTRFHQGDVPPRGFLLRPYPDQRVDAAFTAVADRIVSALVGLGWRQVGGDDPTAAVVRFRYAQETPVVETVLSPSAVPPMGMWGYRRRWDDPFGYWQADRVVIYPKWLSLTIVGGAAADGVPLFEGRVVSRRGGSDMAPILPYLVRGMFDGFPGPSGRAETKALNVVQP